jgi:hypothetical protein
MSGISWWYPSVSQISEEQLLYNPMYNLTISNQRFRFHILYVLSGAIHAMQSNNTNTYKKFKKKAK